MLVGGAWALNRWRFPETAEPDLAISVIDATLSRSLDDLIVRLIMRNPHRTAIRTGPWASAVFHIGESPLLRADGGPVGYQELINQAPEEVQSQSALQFRPQQEIQFSYPISSDVLEDATQLSLIVIFEHVEWIWSLFGPWRRKRYDNLFREFVVDLPEAAWYQEDDGDADTTSNDSGATVGEVSGSATTSTLESQTEPGAESAR